MGLQLNKPRTLFDVPNWIGVEYEPQKRSIICSSGEESEKDQVYYLDFPYLQFVLYRGKGSETKESGTLFISMSKKPAKFDKWFRNTYKVPLPNIHDGGSVCLGDIFPTTIEEAVSLFWTTKFDPSDGKPKFLFKKHLSLYSHGHIKINGSQGLECWMHENEFHREDGPAYIDKRIEEWYKHGVRHRIGGPSATYNLTEATFGIWKEWRVDGLRHREDGPAIIFTNGAKEWCVKGQRHRDDGPACINITGKEITYEWYQNGQLHRVGGPAILVTGGGRRLETWYRHGKVHRENGPAQITDEKQNWWIDGKQVQEKANWKEYFVG